MTDLVMGIDTGSTYTDGVLLDYGSKTVVATTKALTTRHDLSVGIIQAIDDLAVEDPSGIKLVSISTTLATNSIVEGKNQPVALILIGYDPELIAAFNLARRFATPKFHYFQGGHDVYGEEKEPLDLDSIIRWVEGVKDEVSAIAISSYFSPLNPTHEERAYEAITGATDLPVVLGHQLSTKLNSIHRAATATLNASLIGILREFIKAVQEALQKRDIQAPLMVVRGDGALMRAEVAVRRPLETALSGPAASAIGGRFLSGRQDAVVIDIGGTTTDICLVDDGQVAIDEEGAVVGGFATAVKAADIRSIGLGGDSHISLDRENQLAIGPERVVPLSYLAFVHPSVRKELHGWSRAGFADIPMNYLEHWYLIKEPPEAEWAKEPVQRGLVDLLRGGPWSLAKLLAQLDLVHPSQLAADRWLKGGIIGKAGLTPTDVLHATGQFTAWDTEAATVAVEIVSGRRGQSPGEFAESMLDAMAEAIVAELVTFLTQKRLKPRSLMTSDDLGRWFFDNNLYPADPYLETSIRLKYPIVGIGAPAKAFLSRVAEILKTDLIVPPHYDVGNAVGTVAGNVVISREALIFPRYTELGIEGYYAQIAEERRHFQELTTALAYAERRVGQQAQAEATAAGATDPTVIVEGIPSGVEEYRVVAKAVGNPRLAD